MKNPLEKCIFTEGFYSYRGAAPRAIDVPHPLYTKTNKSQILQSIKDKYKQNDTIT